MLMSRQNSYMLLNNAKIYKQNELYLQNIIPNMHISQKNDRIITLYTNSILEINQCRRYRGLCSTQCP